MPARRQFEQGDSLLQRTLRERQTTQLRSFCGAAAVPAALLALLALLASAGRVGKVNDDASVGPDETFARFSASGCETEDPPRLSPSAGLEVHVKEPAA